MRQPTLSPLFKGEFFPGANHVMIGHARLLITDRSEEDVEPGHLRIGIDGVALLDTKVPGIDGTFSMLECGIILIPKILHTIPLPPLSNTMRIGQLLTSGYNREENWKKAITINKEI